jgi:hypothetical protein
MRHVLGAGTAIVTLLLLTPHLTQPHHHLSHASTPLTYLVLLPQALSPSLHQETLDHIDGYGLGIFCATVLPKAWEFSRALTIDAYKGLKHRLPFFSFIR